MSAAADTIERCPLGKTDVPCCLARGHRGPCKYKCCEPSCPGFVYPASVVPHPCRPNDEHPLAVQLRRKFKPGSGTLTKTEAWKIADELDRLHAIERKLESMSVAEVEAQRRRESAQQAMRDAGFDA